MGSGNSKSLNRKQLIKFFNKPDVIKHLCEEHTEILNKKTQGTFNVFTSEENFNKNRYSKEPCFDYSRVIFQNEEYDGDFINASHIDGFEHPKKFIVSQAPLEETVANWWRMIWEQKCEIIVMLCKLVENGKSQCYPYWSLVEGETLEFGSLTVKTIEVNSIFSNFLITKIVVTHKERGSFTHFMYKKYPEGYILSGEEDFLDLVMMIKIYDQCPANRKLDYGCRRNSNRPIVVHDNGGLERAMTFCTVDIALNSLIKADEFNMYSIVKNLRK